MEPATHLLKYGKIMKMAIALGIKNFPPVPLAAARKPPAPNECGRSIRTRLSFCQFMLREKVYLNC